jgi:hypothetical protein
MFFTERVFYGKIIIQDIKFTSAHFRFKSWVILRMLFFIPIT